VVSPKGYYMTDPEADEPEEGAGSIIPIIINPEYEGLTNEQLLNTSNWVHHTPYILPQGRATWEAPKLIKEKELEEKEDEEDEQEEENQPEPEVGPPPLNPVASDEGNINSHRTWLYSGLVHSVMLSVFTHKVFPRYVAVQSMAGCICSYLQ
jgi:radial spoke head protein 4/6